MLNLFREATTRYLNYVQRLRILGGHKALPRSRLVREVLSKSLPPAVGAPAAVVLLKLLGAGFLSYVDIAIAALLGGLLALLLPILIHLRRALARGRRAEAELTYFIISEGVSTGSAKELIKDLVELGPWSSVFPHLTAEARKLSKFRRLMPIVDAVKTYTKWIRSSKVSRTLTDYLLSLSLGTAPQWLQERTDELISEVRARAAVAIKLRATVAIVLAVLLGYVPPLASMLSLIAGEHLLTTALTLTMCLVPVAFILTPRLPEHLAIIPRGGRFRVAPLAPIATGATAYLLVKSPSYAIIAASAVGIALGVVKLREYVLTVVEASELPRVISALLEAPLTLANPVAVVKDVMRASRAVTLRGIGRAFEISRAPQVALRARLWLSRFVVYVISKSIESGSVSRERLMKLRELVIELVRDFKATLSVNLAIASIAIALPAILALISFLGTGATPLITAYDLVGIVAYSTYATYIVFNDLGNTLLPSSALLTFALMGGIR